jgi:hypothetical protein
VSAGVPYTRTLGYVLREQLNRQGLRLLVAPVTAIPDPGHVTIDQGGSTVTVARLRSYTPTVGDGAVCIAAAGSIIAIGAIDPATMED